jgi:hypothetical protein
VPVVPRVFANHVRVQPAQVDRDPLVAEPLIKAPAVYGSPGQRDFGQIGGEVCLSRGGVGQRELGVSRFIEVADVLVSEPDPEPDALVGRLMADQAEQGEPRGCHRPGGELLAGQTRALVQQRRPLEIEPAVQPDSFIREMRRSRPLGSRRGPARRGGDDRAGLACRVHTRHRTADTGRSASGLSGAPGDTRVLGLGTTLPMLHFDRLAANQPELLAAQRAAHQQRPDRTRRPLYRPKRGAVVRTYHEVHPTQDKFRPGTIGPRQPINSRARRQRSAVGRARLRGVPGNQ